jgi:general secretion pathway protein N
MRILRILFLILITLFAIAAVVAWTCPAEFAYRYVADRLGPIKLSGVDGSVWNGRAAGVQVFGRELGALNWKLDAAPLLSRELIAHVDLKGSSIAASGVIDRSADGVLNVRDAKGHLPAALVAPALDIPTLQLLGDIDATIAQATVRGAWMDSATGVARWSNTGVSGAAEARFGDVEAIFSSAPDGSIAGVVHDLGGPLEIAGTFKVANGAFDAQTKLTARDNDAQVLQALQFVGEPQADGTSLLKIHGELFKIF